MDRILPEWNKGISYLLCSPGLVRRSKGIIGKRCPCPFRNKPRYIAFSILPEDEAVKSIKQGHLVSMQCNKQTNILGAMPGSQNFSICPSILKACLFLKAHENNLEKKQSSYKVPCQRLTDPLEKDVAGKTCQAN